MSEVAGNNESEGTDSLEILNSAAELFKSQRRQHSRHPMSRMGSWSAGGDLAITRNEGPDRKWKYLPYPGEKSPEKDLFHNQNGKGTGGRVEVGWAHSSEEGEETPQSQGALLQGVPQSKRRGEVR